MTACSTNRVLRAVLVFGVTLLASGAAWACPDPGLNSAAYTFGADDFSQTRSFNVEAGGEQLVAQCSLTPSARGYARADAEFALSFTAPPQAGLQMSVDSACDTTLLVRRADGFWVFDDDSNGNLDPSLVVDAAGLAGRVDIWVGTFNAERCPAQLNLTSASAAPAPAPLPAPAPAPLPAPAPAPQAVAGCPNPGLVGTQINASGDFLYSPQTYPTSAAGLTPVAGCNIPGAFGFMSANPNFTFFLDGMTGYRLELEVSSGCDTTMLVYSAATGQWFFDDDSNGNLDPRLDLRLGPQLNGRLDVWLGSFGGGGCPASLELETWLN